MIPQNNILFDVQQQIADTIRADERLSAITWLEENRRDIDFEIKNALGKQGLVGVIMTPKAEYIGDYINKTLVWELNPLEIDIVENVPVSRGLNNALSVTGQDAAMRLFDVLCPQRNNAREGAISPVGYEQGEDNSLIVNKCTFKCYVTDYSTADNEDTVVTYLDGTVKSLPIFGEIASTSIADKSNVKSVRIGRAVTSIGAQAFRDCDRLSSVTIPDGVTSIGNSAFGDCSSLTDIEIPSGLTSIGVSAFSGCSGLTDVTIPDGVERIRDDAFNNCTGLTNVTIGSGVARIGTTAFNNCTSLTHVTIPDSVRVVDSGAFYGCSSLLSVRFGNGISAMSTSVFRSCGSLATVTIPDSVTIIGHDAFDNCYNLASVTIFANGGDAEAVKTKMIAAGVSENIQWIMPDA